MNERARGIERVKGVVLAALLMSAWAATYVNYRLGIASWRHFKIEMPTLTAWSLTWSDLLLSNLGFVTLLCLAILVFLRERWAWTMALVPLVLLILLNGPALLPVFAVVNQLGGPQSASSGSALLTPLLATAWTLFVIAAFTWALLPRSKPLSS